MTGSANESRSRSPGDGDVCVETSPLLGSSREQGDAQDDGANSTALRPLISTGVLYGLFMVFIELGGSLSALPFKQLLEDAICSEIHDRSSSQDCGADDQVQSRLALLLAWSRTALLVPGILTAIPYGYVADKYGSRPVMVLSCTGMALDMAWSRAICWWPDVFPVRWVWTAPLLTLIGGGGVVLNATVFANISGLLTESYRASALSFFVAVSLGTRLLTMILTSELMEKHGAWLPTKLAFCIAIVSIALPLFLPTSTSTKKKSSHAADEQSHDTDESHMPPNEEPSSEEEASLAKRIRDGVNHATSGASFLLRRRGGQTTKLMLSLALTSIAWQSSGIAAQFARRKFGWSWSQIAYISILNDAVSIFVFTAIMPAVTYLVVSKLAKPASKGDIAVARACCLLFVLGVGIVVTAHSGSIMLLGLAVFDIATVYNVVLKSLLVVAVGESSAMLFNCIAILETGSALITGPLVAVAFKIGLSLGGFWVGLPFVIGAGFASLAFVLLCTVTIGGAA